jgi:hypothetical protein
MMRRIPLVLAAVAALTLALPSLARPQGALISFTGQLLDVRNGYVYFTTGDAAAASETLRARRARSGDEGSRRT